MNVKKKIKFKILNREDPEIERLRQQTFDRAKKGSSKKRFFEDSEGKHVDPLINKDREAILKDLNESLSEIPEKKKP